MPRKKGNSPYYKVQRKNLPGYGDTGLLSTRTKSLRRAQEMEDLLEWLADEEMYDLLDALKPQVRGGSGRLTLPKLLRAKKENRIADVRRGLIDPPLEKALREFAPHVTYNNFSRGLRHLLRLMTAPDGPRLAPAGARLSWLTVPAHINTVTRHMMGEGYKPKTVQNSVWGVLSKLLQHHYGKGRARDILGEAERPNADDARDVWLSAEDCRRVISACEWEMRMALLLMASTGVDVGPLLKLRVGDFDRTRWTLYVPDTKAKSRKRTLDLSPVATYTLALMAHDEAGQPRKASDRILTLTRGQLNYRWRLARTAAGLTEEEGFRADVRIKDLRHTFAVHYLKGGGNLAGLMGRMGHTRGVQSLAYAKHERRGLDDMEEAARALGLALPDRLYTELEELAPRPGEVESEAPELPSWWFDRHALPRLDDGELSVVPRYQERGTAGWAEDSKAYDRDRRRRQTKAAEAAQGAGREDSSGDSEMAAEPTPSRNRPLRPENAESRPLGRAGIPVRLVAGAGFEPAIFGL